MKRGNSRSRVLPVVVVVVLAIALVVGVGVYGSAIGIHLFSPAPSVPFTVSNITLTSYPSLTDGNGGLGLSADIANHGTAKIENTTFAVNTVPMGSCTTAIQPGSQALCRVGQDLSCNVYPAAPYAVKVTVEFQGGATDTTTTQLTIGELTVFC